MPSHRVALVTGSGKKRVGSIVADALARHQTTCAEQVNALASAGRHPEGWRTVMCPGWVLQAAFAHALLESRIPEGGPVGVPAAHYVFRYTDGEEVRLPIRERFEVGVVPVGWGQLPFLAVPANIGVADTPPESQK